MKKLIIFDMDGTILDTIDDLGNSLNLILNKYQFPLRTKEEIKGFIGDGLKKLLERGLPKNIGSLDINNLFNEFKEIYQAHSNNLTKPYKGIVELLNDLKEEGYLLGVVSNKPDLLVKELVDEHFINTFDIAIGEQKALKKKPDPDMVYKAMDYLNIDKSNAIYVGDTNVDYETAKNAGITSILVSWGFRSKEDLLLLDKDNVVDNTSMLKDKINIYFK